MKKFFFGLSFLLVTSCAYRFSNLQRKPPAGIRRIAFESVYDTSRAALPHEILWEELQSAFAVNGRLKVTSPEEADAFLRTHLYNASITYSEPSLPKQDLEPTSLFDPKTGGLYAPSQYPQRQTATHYARREILEMKLGIEVWDLNKKTIIFSRLYPLVDSYPMLDPASGADAQFLNSEAAFEVMFRRVSKNAATRVVSDFLSL